MEILKIFSTLSLAFALSACVVPIVKEDDAAASNCKTTTKSMSLQMADGNVFIQGCSNEACITAALAVFAGSAIISGSIVLTANTVHWLEYQGTCSDGYLNIAKQRFLESENKPTSTPTPIPAI
jgi:hypothetical protein